MDLEASISEKQKMTTASPEKARHLQKRKKWGPTVVKISSKPEDVGGRLDPVTAPRIGRTLVLLLQLKILVSNELEL